MTKKVNGRYDEDQMKLLCRAFMAVETEEECMRFLEDLMTVQEMQDMSQRLYVAKRLREGLGYQKISEEVSVSSATISRVNRCLNYGTDGYRAILDKIGE